MSPGASIEDSGEPPLPGKLRDFRGLLPRALGLVSILCSSANCGRFYAHRLIVDVTSNLLPMLPTGNIPTSERQARELAPLRAEPEKLKEVWRESVETFGPEPTDREIRSARLGVELGYSTLTFNGSWPEEINDNP